MKKIALAVLLAFVLVPAATFAQIVVRIAPPAPIVERRPPPPDRALCGLTDTIAGTAGRTSGFRAGGIAHRIRAHTGLLTAGFAYTITGKCGKGTGASHLRWGGRRLRASCAEGERGLRLALFACAIQPP